MPNLRGNIRRLISSLVLVAGLPLGVHAATTIDPAAKYAFGANIGWMDWTGDLNNGAIIGDYVCSGFIYAANVGWINLGGGGPANGIRYQNLAANDFGVNHDGLGNLRGFAYGANIGWINFEDTGAPSVDLRTGQLYGFAFSANCGWISLSNLVAGVQTDTFSPGALDLNGLPVAWELSFFGATGVDPAADPDHDGLSNEAEYLAGTSPVNGADFLRITSFSFAPGGTNVAFAWTSVPTRFYHLQSTTTLSPPEWGESALISPDGASTTRTFSDTNAPIRFYRIRAVRPLAP